jgi:hypothetical protein
MEKSNENGILYLTLKKEWFDQILAGTKTSEYREYKKFWIKRLMNPAGNVFLGCKKCMYKCMYKRKELQI